MAHHANGMAASSKVELRHMVVGVEIVRNCFHPLNRLSLSRDAALARCPLHNGYVATTWNTIQNVGGQSPIINDYNSTNHKDSVGNDVNALQDVSFTLVTLGDPDQM